MAKKKRFFQYVGKTHLIHISSKILAVFILLLLLSNFSTNFINMQLHRNHVITLTNQILVNELKEIYTVAENQFEIFRYTQDRDSSLDAICTTASKEFKNAHSTCIGIEPGGNLVFITSSDPDFTVFKDSDALHTMNMNRAEGILEGSIRFSNEKGEFLGVYKYSENWKCYLIRAELNQDMNESSRHVFMIVSQIIVVMVLVFMLAGLKMFSNILKYINRITESLYKMQVSQKLELIDLKGAPNDDITYLGISFNSLSSTINNLLSIFQKFVTQDVVKRAYQEHNIRLEGKQNDLTILFSDIRGFTYMTETLGNDIINLLNIHYNQVIHGIHENKGIIGSIIGDAVLAIYGTLDSDVNKSVLSVQSAWEITRVTAMLREKMKARRIEIESERKLSESEEHVFKAILIDVGVGIDGGKVFYGNIGSSERMTNTVIGDNVNSASRLEGLTRIYKLPVVISEYVKDEVEKNSSEYIFFEIDTVQVKGKTLGKKIFIPFEKASTDEKTLESFRIFEKGLEDYYAGRWPEAEKYFRQSGNAVSGVFLERISGKNAPADWSGIWTMTTK